MSSEIVSLGVTLLDELDDGVTDSERSTPLSVTVKSCLSRLKSIFVLLNFLKKKVRKNHSLNLLGFFSTSAFVGIISVLMFLASVFLISGNSGTIDSVFDESVESTSSSILIGVNSSSPSSILIKIFSMDDLSPYSVFVTMLSTIFSALSSFLSITSLLSTFIFSATF